MISSWSDQPNHLISSSGLDSTIAASLFNKGVLCFIRLWLIEYLPELIHARKKRIERHRLFSYRRIEIWIYEWSSVRLYANWTSLLHSLARFLQELTLDYLTLSLLRCSQLIWWYSHSKLSVLVWLTKLRLSWVWEIPECSYSSRRSQPAEQQFSLLLAIHFISSQTVAWNGTTRGHVSCTKWIIWKFIPPVTQRINRVHWSEEESG